MKQTIITLQNKKKAGEKIAMLTAYDYSMARLCAEAGCDMLLVGDSLGMVMLGYPDTVSVTMDDMVHHTRAVSRGQGDAFLVADMPFMSYRTGIRDALNNATRLMAEGRCQAVKIEGGSELCELVRQLKQGGIPVVGHLGLTPQSVNTLGGYKVQAKEGEAATRLLHDALALDAAGVMGIVLECVPRELARLVTEKVSCFTIGIGAGPDCDGQVLVLQDMLSMYSEFRPKFVQAFADVGSAVKEGVRAYCTAVREGFFPDDRHSFAMDKAVLEKISSAFTAHDIGLWDD